MNILRFRNAPEIIGGDKKIEYIEQQNTALKSDMQDKGYDPLETYLNMSADFLGITLQSLTIHEFYKKYKHHIKNCIDLIAEDVMDMEWGFFKDNKKLEKIEEVDFFMRPNLTMDWQDFVFCTVGCLEIGGDAYWWYPEKFRLANIKKIFFLPAQFTSFDYNDAGHWIGYKFNQPGMEMHFSIEEIIHFKYPNPGDPNGYGVGTVQSLESQVSKYDSLEDFENALLDNMGIMSAVVTGGSQRNNNALVVELRRMAAGSKKAGKIVGAPKGFEIKDAPGFSPQEIGLFDIEGRVEGALYKCFKVPPLLVGVTEQVNRSNMYEAKLSFKIYKTHKVAKRLQRKIDYSPILIDKDFNFRFIYTLPKDPELEIKKNVEYVQNSIVSPKEVRADEGRPPYPGSDRVLMRIGYVPGESTDKIPSTGKSEKTKPKEDKEFPISNIKVYNPLKFGEYSNKVFRTWQEALEREMAKQLNATWNWLGKKIGANLRGFKAYDPEIVLAEVLLPDDIIADEFAKRNNGYIKESMERMIIQRRSELHIDIPDSVIEQYLIRHYDRLKETWKGIAGTDLKQLSKIITQGLEEDKTLLEIARQIESNYKPTSSDFMNAWRAGTIARTETSMTANITSHDVMKYAGVQVTVWIVSGSGRERAWHLEAHGQTIGIDGFYVVGGEKLLHPQDPSGSAENVINCQCNEVPFESYFPIEFSE